MAVTGNSKVSRYPGLSRPGPRGKVNARQPRKTSGTLNRSFACRIVSKYSILFFVLLTSLAHAVVIDAQAVEEDLVHYGDIVDVDVIGSFEYDWRGGLTPEGNLDISEGYTEPIFALCRSEAAIAADIQRLLGRTLREPKVAVKILDRSNRALARIDGAVRTPMRFQIRRTVRLRELIVMAGGLIDGASGDVTIFRPKSASCKADAVKIVPASDGASGQKDNAAPLTNIKIVDLLSGKPDSNPEIFSGDIVTVSRALPVYIIGAVANPRPIYSREKMTLSRLISSAGGLTKEADPSKIFIFRRNGLDVQAIESDLEKVKKGETIDEVLQPFDIIEVAARGGVKRKYPPVMANDQTMEASKPALPLRIVD